MKMKHTPRPWVATTADEDGNIDIVGEGKQLAIVWCHKSPPTKHQTFLQEHADRLKTGECIGGPMNGKTVDQPEGTKSFEVYEMALPRKPYQRSPGDKVEKITHLYVFKPTGYGNTWVWVSAKQEEVKWK
jgi:hypothetical protein